MKTEDEKLLERRKSNLLRFAMMVRDIRFDDDVKYAGEGEGEHSGSREFFTAKFDDETARARRRSTKTTGPGGLEWVTIPAGPFVRGSYEYPDESPIRKIDMTEFQISSGPIASRQYDAFAGRPEEREGGKTARSMTWNEAASYCRSRGGELPTEAMWEKAMRGRDGRKYPWGNRHPTDMLTQWVRNIEVVGPHGCHFEIDIIAEWCADWFQEDYYKACPHRDPLGPPKAGAMLIDGKPCCVARGGCWSSSPGSPLRTSYRLRYVATDRSSYLGFRCTRTLAP